MENGLLDWWIIYLEYPYDILKRDYSDKEKREIKVNNFKLFPYFYTNTNRIKDKIKEFVCNFIDFLDEPEIIQVVVEQSEEKTRKRIRRGKTPKPTEVNIKITGKLKEYLNSVHTGLKKHFSNSFWVRGYWRHYRSERYKKKKGTKVWIKPFIKGQGILIKKDYKLTKTDIRGEC